MNLHHSRAITGRVVEHLYLWRARFDHGRVAFDRSPIVESCEAKRGRNPSERVRRRVGSRKPAEPREPSRAHMTMEELRGENVGSRIQARPARSPGAGIENIKNAVRMRLGRVEGASRVALDDHEDREQRRNYWHDPSPSAGQQI